jgi:general secretion pathway protein B
VPAPDRAAGERAAPNVAERTPSPVAEVPVRTVAAPAPQPVEEYVRTLQELPEAIRREVPRVSLGGYIYSPNPADRLLLVDKMLRREGDEVAPGLVLEKLQPRHAVMNYRGHRYRVAY